METIKKKITFERLVAFIMLLTSLGLFTFVEIVWDKQIEKGVKKVLVEEYKNPQTGRLIVEPTEFTKDHLIRPSVDTSLRVLGGMLENKAAMEALMKIFSGFKDLEEQELKDYIQTRFEFADRVMYSMDSMGVSVEDMISNHTFVKKELEKLKSGNLTRCGYVLKDISTNKPTLFVDCIGLPKKIYFGKPIGRENLSRDVHYYFNENGRPIIITYLSNIVITH